VNAKSVPFDQAVAYYDDTRKLTDSVQQQIIDLLVGELEGRGRTLEIGVGTGRWALPLHEQGLRLAGVDVSAPMLQVLLEKAGGTAPFALAVADATALPFKKDSFGAAFACHVFHLIPNWKQAVMELTRVIRLGGILLVDIGGGHGIRSDIKKRFAELLGKTRVNVGLNGLEPFDEFISEIGLSARELPTVTYPAHYSVEEIVRGYEENKYSFTWDIKDADRLAAAYSVRKWAIGEFGDISRTIEDTNTIAWRAYDIP
jgi:SAM-dependent methyltransferase